LLVLGLAFASRHARAEGEPQGFAIAAQSLEGVLTEFAEQAGVQLLVRTELVEGLRSPGLSGRYTPEEALSNLLAGTGFTYRRDSLGTLTLERAASPPPEPLAQAAPPPEPEVVVLPILTVTASPLDETSYNVLDASTATKTDTPIMETPVSIQVVPQRVLADQQAIDLEDALKNVSGVTPQFGFSYRPGLVIRGFESRENQRRDGVLVRETRQSLANVDRVEVLKGPAAILYGSAEPGGVINLVTKRPQTEPYYSLSQQFGSFDTYRTLLDATGSLIPGGSLSYRLNFEYLDEDRLP